MNGLGVKQLLDLSKQAKKNKDNKLEREYLNQAIALAPTNTRVINALIRNLRKDSDKSELKKWLEKLYKLKPNGKILFELMELEKKEGNSQRLKEILIENARIDPNSKKVKKRLERAIEREYATTNNAITSNPTPSITPSITPNITLSTPTSITPSSTSLFTLTEADAELIRNVREIIYSDANFSSKYDQVVALLAGQPEEIALCILAELYINDSSQSLAINFVKRYKKGLNPEVDIRKMKLVNKLLQLVLSKKTVKYNWNDFWRYNTTILPDEKDPPKVLVKNTTKE